MNARAHLDPVISMQTVRIPGVHMFARASLVLLEVGKHVPVRDFAFISLSNLSVVPFVTTQGCINLDCHKKLQLDRFNVCVKADTLETEEPALVRDIDRATF